MRVGADVHGPQHRVIPAAGITDEQRVFDSPPREAVVADRVCDEIVIRKNEVKQMVDAIVIKNIDVTESLSGAGCF